MTIQVGSNHVLVLTLLLVFALAVGTIDYFGRRAIPRKRRHRHT